MKRWRIGIVRLGAAARNIHLPAFRKTGRIEVVGGVDPFVAGADFRFPLSGSLAEMASEAEPDIIAIATPPDSDFDLACERPRAGAHVFCEKPFVLTLDRLSRGAHR